MKKSKFLKKSLAMLLAVMMVVAMIPLSAAAAEGDPTIYVNNLPASGDGKTYTLSVSEDAINVENVEISWLPQTDVTLYVVDKDGEAKKVDDNKITVNLTEDAAKSGEVYTLTLRTAVEQAEDSRPITKDYTLEITVKETVDSSDATISSLTNEDGALEAVTNWTIVDNTITLYTVFGTELDEFIEGLSGDVFVATAGDKVKSKELGRFNNENTATLTVTAQNGRTETYTVVVKENEGITSFTVPEQTEETKIDGSAVTIQVPYGYADDFADEIVPTFELADGIVALTKKNAENAKDQVITSGESKVLFTKAAGEDKISGTATLWAWTDTGAHVDVTVTLEAPAQNPEAVLKTVKVGDSNEITVEGTTVTVELPADFDFAKDGPVTVEGTASEGATVSVSAQNPTGVKAVGGKFELEDIAVNGKTFVITVKSEDGDTTSNYTINLTKAASGEAALNDFSVKYTDKDNKEIVYTAKDGTLTLPYSAKGTGAEGGKELANYKVVVQVNAGSKVTNHTIINGDTGLDTLVGSDNKITLEVTGVDASVKTYTITVKYEDGKTGKALTSAGFVSVDEEKDINDDTTLEVTKGTAKLDGKTVTTLKVTVPFSFDEDNENVYLNELVLSEGAKAYKGEEEIALVGNEDKKPATEFTFTEDSFKAVNDKGELDDTKALVISVLSEEEVVDGVGVDKGNKIYVYAERAEAASGRSVTSIESTLDENVTAKVSGTTITITVPGSYADGSYGEDGDPDTFTLNFKLSKMAKLFTTATPTDDDAALVSDNGNEDKAEEATDFSVNKEGELLVDGTPVADNKLYVRSEDGNVNPYTVKTVINEKEDGAELTAVTVNGIRASISGKTVTVNLPFGTNLYPVKLGLTASKMAEITIVGEGLYNEDTNYDLNKEIKISVKSEDGKTTNVYTLKATTADQFSDVDTDDWYYNNVMRAVELGILSGYTDGTFRPMNNITRRDFAIMLAQSLGHDNDEEATSPFKDVADTDYGVSSIAYLYENEITVGDSNGNFNPDANITRQEAAIMLVKAFEATGTSSDLYADDAQIASWAKSFVYTAKAAGLMKGDDHNEFNPTDRLTRAEAASAMVNAVDN